MAQTKETTPAWSTWFSTVQEMMSGDQASAMKAKMSEMGEESMAQMKTAMGHTMELTKSGVEYQMALMSDLQKMNMEIAKDFLGFFKKD